MKISYYIIGDFPRSDLLYALNPARNEDGQADCLRMYEINVSNEEKFVKTFTVTRAMMHRLYNSHTYEIY